MAVPTDPHLQWTLLFNVFFGSIASRAFSEFYQSIFNDRDEDLDLASRLEPKPQRPPRYFPLRILIFVSAFVFYIYDWIVLQILYTKFEYTVTSKLSFLRFGIDLLMAFCLFAIVSIPAHSRVLKRPLRLIAFVSVWHILAATWRILASRSSSHMFHSNPHCDGTSFTSNCCIGRRI